MAEEGEVLEEKPEVNEEIQTEMLPPALPGTMKKEVKSHEKEEKGEKYEKEDEGHAKMLPPSEGSDVKSETRFIEKKKRDEVRKEKKIIYPEIPYKEPAWSGVPNEPYNLELLKGGCIKSTKYLTEKPYYLFGRLPNCDIVMEHPSISRYHAVIQYKASQSANSDKGFYLYDLGSTHGTLVNKVKIEPKKYYRLRVGYVIKFGGSSRLYILQGPEDIEEDEILAQQNEDSTIKLSSEVGKVMSEEEYEEWKQKEKKPEEEDEGITWGFGEDAVEDDIINPFASEVEGMETHVFKDPKKTLRGFFEREGLDLEYQVEEKGPGHARVYHCRIKLPVETASGDPLYAEAAITGKKREAVLACATEACRILDMNGLLRQSSHESKKHKIKNWEENDYYDSDEDTFLDRTGSIEKKRNKRMKLAKKDKEEAETFESLSSKLKSVEEEITSLEAKLEEAMQASKAAQESQDSLDSYMQNIDKCMDKTSRMQIRRKIFDLKKEKQHLAKLVQVAKPASLPELINPNVSLKGELKDNGDRIKEKIISTPSAATTSTQDKPQSTSEADSSIRHEQALLEDAGLSSSASINLSSAPTSASDNHLEISKKDSDNKTAQCAVPALPSLKMGQKPKQKIIAPPDSSLSKVLEGLKSSSGQGVDSQESASKKHHSKEQSTGETFKKPLNKKKRKMLPQASPSMSPPPTKSIRLLDAEKDEDYTDWTPPTDQSGDGRTKLNEKYGY